MRSRAFTLIEILMVVSIIALLATITVVGLRYVGGNAKEKQARTTLEVVRSVFTQAVPVDDPKGADKFYGNVLVAKYGITDITPSGGLSAFGLDHYMETVQAGSDVKHPSIRTAEILAYLASNQASRSQIESLPPQSRRTVFFNKTDRKFESTATVPGKEVVTLNAPVDPWGMPIEFVYGNVRLPVGDSLVPNSSLGGLSELSSKSAAQYWPGPRTPLLNLPAQPTPPAYMTPSGMTARPNNEKALQAPDKGCFWVSAGADEKFETHDDNLYSFEGN